MANNKVQLADGTVLIDLTDTTATADTILQGYGAYAANGEKVAGTIESKSSTDLTVSGATVTAPAGYYASNASKSVANGSAKTPATTITANPTISVNSTTGLITATASGSKSVTPTVTAGYVSSGTAGTVSVSGSKTSQLSTQAAATVTPTENEQTAVAAGKYTTGAVKVAAIPSDYVGSDIDIRSSTDLTVSGATVTAPAGYYAESASKAVASGSASVANTTITTVPSITVSSGGLITASVNQSQGLAPTVTPGYVSTGIAGTIYSNGSKTHQLTVQTAQTIYPSTSDQTIESGRYLTGTQTIKAVTTSGLSAANIKDGVVIEVGDSADSDRITKVTGSFTDASTVSSGQVAATSSEIITGYSAWVDGLEVKGSLRAMTTAEILNAVNEGWNRTS